MKKEQAKPVAQNKEITIAGDGMSASVEALISRAIDKGIPVETMEKILAMGREIRSEQAKRDFDEAMAKFQAECPIISKDKKVDFTSKRTGGRTNYSYAPLDEIVRQVKELIAKNGLSYTIQTENTTDNVTSIVRVRHINGHSEITRFEVPIDKTSFMSAQQQYGAASTFGKRYAFTNAFGILTGDEDNDAVHGEEPNIPAQPKRAYSPTPQPKNWIRDPHAPISPKQITLIENLLSDTETDEKSILDATNRARLKLDKSAPQAVELNGLKMGEASQIIDLLNAKKNKVQVIDNETREVVEPDNGEIKEGEIVQ